MSKDYLEISITNGVAESWYVSDDEPTCGLCIFREESHDGERHSIVFNHNQIDDLLKVLHLLAKRVKVNDE